MRQNGNAQPGPGGPARPAFPLSRGGIIGVSAIGAMLVAAAITAVAVMGGGSSPSAPPAAAAGNSRTAATGHARADSDSAARMPQLVAAPQMAVMPNGAGHSGSPKASGSPTSSASAHPTPSASASSPAPSSSRTSAPPPPSSSCTHPKLVTSDPNGSLSQSPYTVTQDMWNAGGYSVSQTLHACSYSSWYVTATMNNDSGDGAVKTYPNSHRDFDSSPAISSLGTISSTFAESGGGSGIYEYAYDIWLDGWNTELMIWTDNHGQSPGCSQGQPATVDGRSYQVCRSGSYIAFVAGSNFKSGTMNLSDFFEWLMSKGWITSGTTLRQVDYGIELVSTNNDQETFAINNFSVTAN